MSNEMFRSMTEFERVRPQRPLGELSNFVVEHMPLTLFNIREGGVSSDELAITAEYLVNSVTQNTIDSLTQPNQSRGFGESLSTNYPLMIAHLDTTMLEAAIVHSGGTPSDRLMKLVDILSEASDQVPGITYEGITYINPQDDIRTFTLDDKGNPHPAEAHFYKGHVRIEKGLDQASQYIHSACRILSDPDIQKQLSYSPQELLNEASQLLKQSNKVISKYKTTLPSASFRTFRQYLTNHPIRDIKGPSGAFSPGIPVLDMQIAGMTLPRFMFQYYHDNFKYFPRQGRHDIKNTFELIQQGVSLNKLIPVSDPFIDSYDELKEQMRIFRALHLGAVHEQLADIMTGTAGEEIQPFLTNRLKLHNNKFI